MAVVVIVGVVITAGLLMAHMLDRYTTVLRKEFIMLHK